MTFACALLLAAAVQGQGTPPVSATGTAVKVPDANPSLLRTIERGDQSNIEDAKQAVARTAAEWSALWQQHTPDRPLPRVDFTREMVVGVFLGTRSTAGFGIEVVSAQSEGGALLVRYRQAQPGRGAITAQVITSPYHLVAIPRSSETVKFERTN